MIGRAVSSRLPNSVAFGAQKHLPFLTMDNSQVSLYKTRPACYSISVVILSPIFFPFFLSFALMDFDWLNPQIKNRFIHTDLQALRKCCGCIHLRVGAAFSCIVWAVSIHAAIPVYTEYVMRITYW